MTRRQSVRIQFLWSTVRAAIKFSDWARRAAPVMLLMGVLFTGAAVWLTVSTEANHWVWKGWERMFGPAATINASPGALAQPEGSGMSGNYTITAIDEPNAGTSATEGTLISAISASGTMTGGYSDSAGVLHGLVYANGKFTSFDAPNAGSSPQSGYFQGTLGIGIDTAGDVAGIYADSNNAYHGFILPAGGTLTGLDDPNAPTATSERGTFPMAINDNGQIVGTYTTCCYDTISLYHGFLYSIANGTYTEIDEPNAGTGETSYGVKEGTTPMAINASGVVTGYYVDSNGNRHGFIYLPGSYTAFDGPGATTNTGKGGSFSGTIPTGIDAAGDVVGSYTDSSGIRHGFILPAGSTTPTSFNAPGANTTSQSGTLNGTFPTRIDPTGSFITGNYTDSSSLDHGFVYYLPLAGNSSFVTFTPPNQISSTGVLPFEDFVFGVNASGTVVGFYLDSNEVSHGFEYIPTQTPAPAFNPVQGAYSSQQSVAISDTDSSAFIYYTTNGSTPTVSSTQYTGPITVSSTETINAIALDSSGGYIESAVATATYTITGQTPPTVFLSASPATGVTEGQTVTLTATESPTLGIAQGYSWTIYDGTTALVSGALSNIAGGGFTMTTRPLSAGLHSFKAVYSTSQSGYSTGTSNTFNINVGLAPPIFSPAAGTYTSAQTVTLSDATTGAAIYYTTNGSTPATSSTQYTGPIAVSSTETIEAIAADTGYTSSAVASATYTITIPGFTLSASPASVSVAQGGSGTSTITVTAVGGFSGTVTFAATGLPSGVTASFAAGTSAGTQVLTLTAANTATVGGPVTVSITASSGNLTSTTSVALTIAAEPTFGASGASGSNGTITVTPGATTANTSTISVAGTNGFSGTVTLSCSISPTAASDPPTCSLSPTSVTLNGTTAQTSTLTVTTTAASSAENQIKRLLWPSTGGAALALVLLIGIPRRRRNWMAMVGLVVLLASIGVMGCGGKGSGSGSGGGGGGNAGTTAGTYTVTVTGTGTSTGSSGSVTATVGTVTLKVN